MREIVLDTETTGLDVTEGHRLIEIGACEMINHVLTNKTFQVYINPEREIDIDAVNIHGISNEDLIEFRLVELFLDDQEQKGSMENVIQ